MDASEQFAFPTPQPQDNEEVREAIEKAGVLWAEDPKESLKWLRKAAEVASDAGDDMRSLQLAKVSADLRNLANISPSVPPPTTLPPISVRVPQAAPAPAGANGETASSSGETAGTAGESSAEATEPSAEAGVSGEQSVEAPQSGERTTPGEATWGSGSAADLSGTAADQQPTPNAPMVHGDGQAGGSDGQAGDTGAAAAGGITPVAVTPPSASEAFSIPQVSFSKDPGQTLPATPAATAAAAALANSGAGHQPMAASPSNAPPGFNGNGAGGGLGAKRPTPGFVGSAAAQFGGPRPEQPTLVGRPVQGFQASQPAQPGAQAFPAPQGFAPGPRGVNDQTPAATPAAIQADSVAPNSAMRFVQHRAVEVAISVAPNANGHFDLHPLAEGENIEPGFRRALLVALAPEDRLFPGRG